MTHPCRNLSLIATVLGIQVSSSLSAEESPLPKSIVHTVSKGKHTYSFTGLYRRPSPGKREDPSSWVNWYYPAVVSASEDVKAGTFSVTTSRALSIEKLRQCIDNHARETGEMPYWMELVLRDRKRSEQFSPTHFKVTPMQRERPQKLVWYSASREKPLEIPFRTIDEDLTFTVSRATAHCMAHDRYAIRVLDKTNAIVWENQDLVVEYCGFAFVDEDEDGIPEIFVDRNDHGKEERFVITYSPTLANRLDQLPASRSESTDKDRPPRK